MTDDSVCGIGINGTDCISEFLKEKPTAFFTSALLSAKEHGYKTAEMFYPWGRDGIEPPLDTRTVWGNAGPSGRRTGGSVDGEAQLHIGISCITTIILCIAKAGAIV